MTRRLLAFFCLLAFCASAAPAYAQSDTGEIDIVVQDAATKAPVALARGQQDGPVITREFSGENGKVNFTEVPDGIYRARVFARGFQAVTSANFEVTNGRLITVTVALAQSTGGPLKTIASVVAKSTANVSTTSVDANSAQRKLSDTLADALGKLSGVTLSTSSNDSDATQTVSLEGQDASQTALTLNGIPLNAPGSAGDLRGIGSDLFTRSSVSFGPQIGGLAGGVNFSTLQPTLSWNSEFSLSVGSNGKNNYSFGESGTLGKIGMAVMHTYRATPSLLDGMSFLDTSGLDYVHEGDSQSNGTMVNLRYQPSESQTLAGTFMQTTNGSQLVCAQITGPLPCGYGPNNSYDSTFRLFSLSDDALIGDTQVQASVYGLRMGSTRNELDRYVNGVAEPTGTSQRTSTNGLTFSAILPARDRHTISINGYATGSDSAFTPLVAQSAPYIVPGQHVSYAAVSVNDSIRSNTKLRFNDSLGVSRASNAPASLLAGVGAQWNPSSSEGFTFSYSIGGTAAHAGRFGVLSDPAQLRIDCNGNVAYGNAPGDQPGASSSSSARLGYTHKTRSGLISTQFYRQVQHDVVLPTQVNGSVLYGMGIFPPDYFNQAQQNFQNACGTTASFGPADSYFETPIGNVERVYEGAQISAFYSLGRLVVEPYYNVQVAKALSGDIRLNNPYSITIPASQLPNVPLHRAGITLDYKDPGSLFEWLADANYTGSNNSQNLPAFTTVDAGVDAHLQHGDLVFAASNVFNTYGGVYASSQWAVPYTTLGGTQIATIARPNAPRQYSVTYTVRFGRGVPQARSGPLLAQAPAGRGGRGRGFRQFTEPLPSAPPADPVALAASAMCNAEAQKAAQPVLAALKAYVAQIDALRGPQGYPASVPPANIPGMTVQYHPLGMTYALSLELTQTALLRSLFGCTQFHMADEQTAQQRKLYVPPATGGMFFRPQVQYMPAVGMYFVRRPPQPNTQSFRLYKLPSSPPATPFAVKSLSTLCTAQMHAAAQSALAQLQAHFASGSAAPAWTIAPNTAKAGTWYALEPADIGTVPAILNCGHVAAASREDLAKLGWGGGRPPSLNYAPALGLYIIMGGRAAPSPAP